MKGKRRIAQLLIVAMLICRIPAWTMAASAIEEAAEGKGGEREGYETATPGDGRPGNLATPDGTDGSGRENTAEDERETKAPVATASNGILFSLSRSYGADGEYQLEAEDTSIATYENVNSNSEGNRVELQQEGSVTFDLGKITDFKEGKYLVSVNMNGNSQLIKLSVNSVEKGTIEKDSADWGSSDLAEYSYCWLELKKGDKLTVAEGERKYAHLDWVRLSCLEADYWIEAEDTSAAVCEGAANIHGDGDRVEVNGGGSITFDLSKISGFREGVYRLYAGVNGKRTLWKVEIDGKTIGNISAPGNEKFIRGTCVDAGFGGELALSPSGVIKLSDVDQSWGHVDYIRLIRVGEIQPGPEGVYQLEAEDTNIAAYENVNPNSEGNRAELQQYGSVTFDLSRILDFRSGKYLVSVNMNGNSQLIKLSINGSEKGTITKADRGFGYGDLEEYWYHGTVELTGAETVTIGENKGNYAHLDWLKLVRVDECCWIEAENTSVVSYEGIVNIHGDGDRAEVKEGGGKVTFDLSGISGFSSGIYQMYAGVNGTRTRWSVSVDGDEAGTIAGPGDGRWEKGTCRDNVLQNNGSPREIDLSPGSTICISGDASGWGHVDYIRLVRTGDSVPMFDETDEATGIRVTAPEGILPEGTTIVTDTVSRSVRKEIREQFKENDQKVYFYRFSLKTPGRSRLWGGGDGEEALDRMSELDGEVIARLPIPEGYSDGCELYFAREPGDLPEPVAGSWLEGRKLCFQMETKGGIFILADEDIWKFEGEKYYQKITDGGAAADLQPLEEIAFPIPDDEAFETGVYSLMLRVCGGQNYTILAEGREVAVITRTGTGWGDYELCAPTEVLKLSKGQTVVVRADDHYGWVDYMSLKPGSDFEEESEGVTVEADAGVVPAGAWLLVEPADELLLNELRELFGFAQENAPAMSFYRISLLLEGSPVSPSGILRIRIPVPESFGEETERSTGRTVLTEEQLSLYQVTEDGKKIKLPFRLTDEGEYVEFETRETGLFGLVDQAMGNELYYSAAGYYDQTTGSHGQYADLQPGDVISIPVKDLAGFAESNYILSVCSSGNRTKFMVLVNGVPVGMISRESTDWEEMEEAEFSDVLSLSQEDVITIYAPGLAGAGPYGWVDYVKLKETGREPAPLPAPKTKITLEAEDFYPDELEMGGKVANVNNPSKKVEFPILAADGFEENDYHFTLYTTGTMRNWVVCVNGVCVLSGSRDGSGYEKKYMTRELGNQLIHLKPGDILTVEFPEQDTDNYGNWVDKIVLNSRRRVAGAAFVGRTGGRILVELAGNFEAGGQPHTSVEAGNLIYQGEAYYKAQNDNPAADLQPGEQILIPVSDHGSFAEGTYRLMVRSCGNREFFRVKVNGFTVGNITRKETGYGMSEMTEDTMGLQVDLKPGDILALEGQTGGKYGWVDYVSLSRVGTGDLARAKVSEKNYTWEAEDYYTRQKDNPAADLQPGDEIVIPLRTNGEFPGGNWYVAVISNGSRTAMTIRKNGELIGSITRNETNFDMGSVTMDVLQRPVALNPQDVIAIGAPGDESGPYGWVDRIVLIPAAPASPQEKEEYRYPAQAYGTASLYLPAADLQPGEELRIPLQDNPAFMEGRYRVAVISNGSRERFDVRVNGQSVGSISRRPSDYGDNGMSSDKLERILDLKPSDVITVVGQEGDYFGWVSALVLEPAA